MAAFFSSSVGSSTQRSTQRIFHFHSVFSSASSTVTSATAMSSLTSSINFHLGLPVSSFLAVPSSASFSQYIHHRSSVHIRTTLVLTLAFSLETVPAPVLSLWCTNSGSCPLLSLLTRIVSYPSLSRPSPPPIFSSVPQAAFKLRKYF